MKDEKSNPWYDPEIECTENVSKEESDRLRYINIFKYRYKDANQDRINQIYRSLLVMASANGTFAVKEACKKFVNHAEAAKS